MTSRLPLTHIGRYELVRALGQGGMGRVFEVRDPQQPGRRLALKQLHGQAPPQRARFAREAELLGRVRHPGVVAVHASGDDPTGPFLVMDLVEGEPLSEAMERGRSFSPREAARIVEQLAQAVGALHAHGIVHRDLKPENVLLRPDAHPVLVDFGLARADDLDRLTRSGQMLGSPYAAAPEQLKGGATDPRTDVWGLGVILWALLAGAPPFGGEGLPSLMHAVVYEEPDWSGARIPADLVPLLRRALAKDPAARHADAAALAGELAAFLRGEAPRRGSRGRRRLLLLAVPALALLLGLLARSGSSPARTADPGAPPPGAERQPDPPPRRPERQPGAIQRLRHERPSEAVTGRFIAPERVLTWSSRRAWWATHQAVDPAPGEACLWDVSGEEPRLLRRWEMGGAVEAGDWHRSCGLLMMVREQGAGALVRLDPVGQDPPVKLAEEGVEATLHTLALAISADGTWMARAITPWLGSPGAQARRSRVEVWDLAEVLHAPLPRRRAVLQPPLGKRIGALRFMGGGSPPRLLILSQDDPHTTGNRLESWDLRAAFAEREASGNTTYAHVPAGVQSLTFPPLSLALDEGGVWLGDIDRRVRRIELEALHGQASPSQPPVDHLVGEGIGSAETADFTKAGSHRGPVLALAVSPDGRWLYSASGADQPAVRNEVRAWEVATRAALGAICEWPDAPVSLDLSPDGERVAIGTTGGAVEVWPTALLRRPGVRLRADVR